MSKYCPECGAKLENKDLHLVIVLDESGSMSSVWESTISGVNELLDSQKLSDARTLVSLTKFNTKVEKVWEKADIFAAGKISKEDYVPNGLTALYDAIGSAIKACERDTFSGKVMMAIMTDGEENSSREYNFQSVRRLIEKKKEEGWDFVFLGANIDSYAVGGSLGVTTTVNYAASNTGVRAMANSLSAYTTQYRTTGTSMSSATLQDLVDQGSVEK